MDDTRVPGTAELSVVAPCGEQGEEVERGCAVDGLECKFKSLDFIRCRKPAKLKAKAAGDITIVLDTLFVAWTASFAPPKALPAKKGIITYQAFKFHTAGRLNDYVIYKSLWLRLWGRHRDPV